MKEKFLFVPADCSKSCQWIDPDNFETVNLMIHRFILCDCFEVVSLPIDDLILIVDESGKLRPHVINRLASDLYPGSYYGDYIAGDAIIGRIGLVQTDLLDGVPFFEHDILPLREHEMSLFVDNGFIRSLEV